MVIDNEKDCGVSRRKDGSTIIETDKISLVSITTNDSPIKTYYNESKDDHDIFDVRYGGPFKESNVLCAKCGHYHADRIKKCLNPACKGMGMQVTREELLSILNQEITEKNDHIICIDCFRIKPKLNS